MNNEEINQEEIQKIVAAYEAGEKDFFSSMLPLINLGLSFPEVGKLLKLGLAENKTENKHDTKKTFDALLGEHGIDAKEFWKNQRKTCKSLEAQQKFFNKQQKGTKN